jgi:hypothetical protein
MVRELPAATVQAVRVAPGAVAAPLITSIAAPSMLNMLNSMPPNAERLTLLKQSSLVIVSIEVSIYLSGL